MCSVALTGLGVAQPATAFKKKVAQLANFFILHSAMNINENVKALILQGLRRKKQNKVWLAEQMGLSKSWATRLLNGQLKTLSDDHAEKLMRILDIEFFTLRRVDDTQVSAKGMQLAAEFDRSPAFASVATALQVAMKETVYTPKFIPTEQMAAIGNEIIRIAYANEDKPGKVARLVLELLA